jgi:hypothetical protein
MLGMQRRYSQPGSEAELTRQPMARRTRQTEGALGLGEEVEVEDGRAWRDIWTARRLSEFLKRGLRSAGEKDLTSSCIGLTRGTQITDSRQDRPAQYSTRHAPVHQDARLQDYPRGAQPISIYITWYVLPPYRSGPPSRAIHSTLGDNDLLLAGSSWHIAPRHSLRPSCERSCPAGPGTELRMDYARLVDAAAGARMEPPG